MSDVADHSEMLRALVSDLLVVTEILDQIIDDGGQSPEVEAAYVHVLDAIGLLQEKYE